MTSTAALFDWFERNAEAIRWMPEAGQAHDELRYCARTVTRAVDNQPPRTFAGICGAPTANGTCARPLYRYRDKDELRCDGYGLSEYDVGCRARHNRTQRREWLLRELGYALLPLQLWQQCLPDILPDLTWPSRTTYWRWIEKHQLTPKATVNGVEHFRGRDIVDLVTREQPRIRGNVIGHTHRKRIE